MKPRRILILDNLRSCHNVGSILRTADGFGVDEVLFVGTTPYPQLTNDRRLPHLARQQTAQIAKTALGAESGGKFAYFDSFQPALEYVGTLPLLCLEQTPKSVSLKDFQLPQQWALVVGNEVEGVSAAWLTASTQHLEIPMAGRKESFNVAVAAGIALFYLC